ncbi:MAG: hypothetical protein HC926_05560 [Synechococcaceae cyanobacterium SM2_3_60]|nr:hypothetical protein [Synechococcaceae cyanobacterium SM2_3_60]
MGWFRSDDSASQRRIPGHLRKHYFELRECQRAYGDAVEKLDQRTRRNRLLMQEAVRLRVEFGALARISRSGSAVFDRIVVLLNQQNERSRPYPSATSKP